MSDLRNQIQKARAQFSSGKQYLTQDDFVQLFRAIRSVYNLDDPEIVEIFEMTDENQEGRVPVASVDRILDTIIASEETTENERASNFANRQTIYLKNDKISSNILNELDLDKISELKHIYSICEGGKGFASLDQIREFIGNFKQLTFTPEQLIKIFSSIQDKKKGIVTSESFSELMSTLERTILNQYVDEDQYNPTEADQQRVKKNMESMIMASEAGSDSDEENSPDFLYADYNQDLVKEVALVIEKVDEAVDALKNKAKPINITTILNDAISISSHLEKKLKQNEDKFKDIKRKLLEGRNIEEILNAKIGTLEINLNHLKETMETLQNDNDSLYQKNRTVESQLKFFQHLEVDLKDKNTEIVRLERKLKDIENQNSEIENKYKFLQKEKETIAQNYKELSTLFKKEEERMAKERESTSAETFQRENDYMEINQLRIELRSTEDQKFELEKEKDTFERVIKGLKEHLVNTNEFLQGLKLEKSDIESKYKKLQAEFENLKNDNTRRASIHGPSKRVSVGGENLAKLMGLYSEPIFEGSSPNLRQIKEEDENEQEKPKKQNEEPVRESDPRQFDSLLDNNRFSYNPNENRFSMSGGDSPTKQVVDDKRVIIPSVLQIESFGDSNTQKTEHKKAPPLDLRNLTQDYLALRKNPIIVKMLQKYKEDLGETTCFSDYMYRINSRENREHRILFITGQALYSLHPRKNYQVIRRIPLDKIYRVTVSKSSAGLCAIHVYNDYDYLIDIYKRLNLVLFLQTVFRFKGLKMFSIIYEQSFLVKNRNASTLKQIDEYSKAVANPELQSTYKHCQKYGELYVKSWGLFNAWTPYFFILTEVGFISFSKSGSSKPLEFIPILGYLIIDKGSAGDGKFTWKIKFPHSDFEVSLAADSEIEKRDWIRKIKKLQDNAEKKDKERLKNDDKPTEDAQ